MKEKFDELHFNDIILHEWSCLKVVSDMILYRDRILFTWIWLKSNDFFNDRKCPNSFRCFDDTHCSISFVLEDEHISFVRSRYVRHVNAIRRCRTNIRLGSMFVLCSSSVNDPCYQSMNKANESKESFLSTDSTRLNQVNDENFQRIPSDLDIVLYFLYFTCWKSFFQMVLE